VTAHLSVVLRRIIDEFRTQLANDRVGVEETGDDMMHRVYLDAGGRGAMLAAWDTGMIQISAIDYEADDAPTELALESGDQDLVRQILLRLQGWLLKPALGGLNADSLIESLKQEYGT
jgi:hypothetical protein